MMSGTEHSQRRHEDAFTELHGEFVEEVLGSDEETIEMPQTPQSPLHSTAASAPGSDGNNNGNRLTVSWADLLKLFSFAIFIIIAWARIQSSLDSLTARQERMETEMRTYMPRELQQARDEVIIDKLTAIKEEVTQLRVKLDNK